MDGEEIGTYVGDNLREIDGEVVWVVDAEGGGKQRMQIERIEAHNVLDADVQIDLQSIRHQLELGDTRIRA